MPEGDSIFRAAQTLHRALAGSVVSRFDSVLPALTRVDHDRHLAGRSIESVTSRGKHLLMYFSGDLILHTHMRMNGSWHLYRPLERWRRPTRDMRVLVETPSYVAVGFNVPVAEWLTARQLAHHSELAALGPDLLSASVDEPEIVRRMRALDARPIAEVLLNQRVAAGIGNVFKSEVLFVAGINPFRTVSTLADDQLASIVSQARRLLAANVMGASRTLSPAVTRRTTRSLDPSATLWVYGREGKPCRRCGTAIRSRKTGIDARSTYWCPVCQPEVHEA